MGSTFYYLAAPDTDTSLVDWFAALPDPPLIRDDRALIWFGDAEAEPDGQPPDRPAITLFHPRRIRDDVWTVGEVHVLPRRGLFPAVDRVTSNLGRWLKAHPLVFRQPSAAGRAEDWSWYLRGSVQNIALSVHALPSGMEALQAGVFFIADGDNATTVAAVLNEVDRLR